MSFRKDVDEMMKNVQVDYEMTNNIMNNTVRNSGKKYRGFMYAAATLHNRSYSRAPLQKHLKMHTADHCYNPPGKKL